MTRAAPVSCLFVLVFGALTACGGAGGCPEICEKDAACAEQFGQPVPDVESCTATCEALVEQDGAYGDAVAERAACIDGLTCDELFFECRPSGE